MRRSAHRRKRLNKTDLTKTNDTTNYYKKCGAAAKAAAPSAGISTNNGAAQGEGDRARRVRRARGGGASTGGAGRQGGGGNGGGDGGGGDEGDEGSGLDGGKKNGGGGGGGGGGDGDDGDEERGGRAWALARAAPGVPLGAWLEPRPSGLRVRSGGLSRRSEPSDHLQAGGSLSMHRELCAHSPTGAQSAQAKAGQAPARARPQAMPERARGWAMAVGADQPPSARPSQRCEARLQLPGAITPSACLQAPDLAYTPKIEIFHCCNRETPFASSDASFRADHYGVLRSRLLQRVVALLQVKVWSALAGGHRVSAPHPPWKCMGGLLAKVAIRSPASEFHA